MMADFFWEFKDGVLASLEGFLVLYKLDEDNTKPLSTTNTGQRASSAEPNPRMTILERRRMQEKEKTADRRKSTTPPVISRTKTPAYYRVLQCVGVNVASIALVQLMVWITETLFPDKYSWINTLFASFRLALVMPIFIVIRVLSTLWFADVANAAYRYRGSTMSTRSHTEIIFSKTASDFVHALVVELVFLLQAILVLGLPVPILNQVGGFVLMSLLHSLYSFEYVWMSRGLSNVKRLALVERRWPFHLGFGSLMTCLTMYSDNFIINSCIFGAFFPFFIVSSFLTSIPEQKDSQIPPIHFFHIAQIITNKLSLAVFGRIRPVSQ
ncbi:unnamed protein product [Bursaphelenchus xylophilus]|uniref:(pine wood nematode) hypothetical protein n=1 Tax=Bursaphelenchus xylophilus TaxID=6326 RepID=A0A1I7RNU8_BURXY|nr:unnamed protein product [Bursaphelenchus xylophilus]CAG9124306.1 unnamed protein product [Bursaphelenchus xylophilus]